MKGGEGCLETLKKSQGLKGTAGTLLPSARPHGNLPSHDTVEQQGKHQQTTHNCTAGKGIKKGSAWPIFHLLIDVAWFYQIRKGQGRDWGDRKGEE